MNAKLTIQTILNFFALNLIFNPIVNDMIPINGLGVFLSFIYWGLLLGLSYLLSIFLRNEKKDKIR